MSSSSLSARAAKKSAFSCEPCRKRKVKCDGEKPTCTRCASRRDECIYKLNPTLSYTQRLEERIKELEDQLAAVPNKSVSAAESTHSSPSFLCSQDSQSYNRPSAEDQGVTRSFRSLKIDDDGVLTYHGAPSFFQLPVDQLAERGDSQPAAADNKRRTNLVSDAREQRFPENLSNIPEPFHYLINIHFCWVQPLFHFIYRPAFTRDMHSMGPYYSHTLLNAVLAHSAYWGSKNPATKQLLGETYGGGAVFAKAARSMVFEELSQGVCTIPIIQSLLILSAQECMYGHSTQAWTYSGIAFRLADHLGILVDVEQYGGEVSLTAEDVEIRHRVFWSCYIWDKMVSLYLGRSPTLQHSTVSLPQIMFDESGEKDAWMPCGAGIPPDTSWDYPPTMSHSASTFLSSCQLSVILNEILVHMYDPLLQNTEAEMQQCLHTQERALRHWWNGLPLFLRLDPTALPPVAPPSHIVTLNCLRHTLKILLYRPMLTRGSRSDDDQDNPIPIQNYLVECVTSATSIIVTFDLFCRTFGTDFCFLSVAYSVYIAASIFLLQVQAIPDDQQAVQRLEFCVRALEYSKRISPIIGNAVGVLKKEISALGIDLDALVVPPMQNMPRTDIPIANQTYSNVAQPSQHEVALAGHYTYPPTWAGNLGPLSMPVDPEVFDTISSLQPLSVRVGAIQEPDDREAVD